METTKENLLFVFYDCGVRQSIPMIRKLVIFTKMYDVHHNVEYYLLTQSNPLIHFLFKYKDVVYSYELVYSLQHWHRLYDEIQIVENVMNELLLYESHESANLRSLENYFRI